MMMRIYHSLPYCAVAACLLLALSCGNRTASTAASSTLSRNPTTPIPRQTDSTFLPTQAPADFFGEPEAYLDWQAALMLHVADSILSATPSRAR